MRFLFVDRVLELRRHDRIVAIWDVSPDEDFFAFHFPANAMVPGSLLIESLSQGATILLETSSRFTRKALPGLVYGAKFYRAVRPGQSLTIEMRVESSSEEGAALTGSISCNGERHATATLGMVLAPLDSFFGPDHAALYRSLYENWLLGATLEGFDFHPLEVLRGVLA